MMKQERKISIVTTALFAAFVLVFSILFFILPDKQISDTERRSLTQSPELTWKTLTDGTFSDRVNEYFNDQFPLRETFLGIKAFFERALLKRENNGVLIGSGGQLAVRLFQATDGGIHVDENGDYVLPSYTDKFYESNISAQFKALGDLQTSLAEKGVPLYVILPPRTVDVACSALYYPNENSDSLIACVRENAKGLEHFIDMYDIYRARYDNGEYVYYKTDHHWTTLGAYYAYAELCKAMGKTPKARDEFTVHTATEDFIGTTAAKAGLLGAGGDVIEYWTANDRSNTGVKVQITNNLKGENKASYDSMFDLSFVDGYDKYGLFLSGTNVYTDIRHNTKQGYGKALLLKDSFGHSLAPFLACEYDLTVLNLADLGRLQISADEYECVFVCFNLENLITTSNLLLLKYAPKFVK